MVTVQHVGYLAAVRDDVVVGSAHARNGRWEVFTTHPTTRVAIDLSERAARALLARLPDPTLETDESP